MNLAARSVAAVLAVTAAITVIGLDRSEPVGGQSDLVAEGRSLFVTGCSSCHGTDGKGVRLANGDERGPSLTDAGEAAAYYYLTTGRMPLANSRDVPSRKEPAYQRHEIDALVAYVASLGDGPELPHLTRYGDVAAGGDLFRENCQACHSATGAGGALSYGRNAPPLLQAQRLQVGAAMRSGPGEMPRFGRDAFDDQDVDDVAAYVQYLRRPDDRGGIPLGRLGPIPEGLFVWTTAIGLVLVICVWAGGRLRRAEPEEAST